MKTFFNYGCGIAAAFSFGLVLAFMTFAVVYLTSSGERTSSSIYSPSDVTSTISSVDTEATPPLRAKTEVPSKPANDLSECNVRRDFVLEDDHWERDGPLRYIVGRAVNLNAQREYTFVTVRCNLYDTGGNKIGEASDVVTSIPAGESWKFKCLVADSDATKYKGIFLTGD